MPGQREPEEQRRAAMLRAAHSVAARDGLAAVTGRAAVAASFVERNALRAVLRPAGFDVAQAMTTLEAVLRIPPRGRPRA